MEVKTSAGVEGEKAAEGGRNERRSESDKTGVCLWQPKPEGALNGTGYFANGNTFLPCSFSLFPHGDCGTNSAGCSWNASHVEFTELSIETRSLVREFTPWR